MKKLCLFKTMRFLMINVLFSSWNPTLTDHSLLI